MVNIQEKIEQAFTRLKGERGDKENYPVLSLGKHPFEKEVRLSKDEYGQFNLVLELPKGQSLIDIPVGKALPTQWEILEDDEGQKTYLRVICVDVRLINTFQSLITEMMVNIYKSSAHRPAILEFVNVAALWRTILYNQLRFFTLNEAKGLYGELYVLREFAKVSPQKALKSWRGQENYRHDFIYSDAVEVKTYSSFNEPKVTIHGAYQLDPPQGQNLYLFAIHLEQNESGESLIEMVEDIAELGVPFDTIMTRLGMTYSAIEGINYRFVIGDQKLFKVDSEFPGIRASMLGEAKLTGVSELSYSLNLDLCGNPIRVDSFKQILEDL